MLFLWVECGLFGLETDFEKCLLHGKLFTGSNRQLVGALWLTFGNADPVLGGRGVSVLGRRLLYLGIFILTHTLRVRTG